MVNNITEKKKRMLTEFIEMKNYERDKYAFYLKNIDAELIKLKEEYLNLTVEQLPLNN